MLHAYYVHIHFDDEFSDCLVVVVILRHVQDVELNAVTHSAIVSSCERDGPLDYVQKLCFRGPMIGRFKAYI